jgi:response regulator of citrate/malate metabolism
MDWNEAAEDLLKNILSQTLRPLRESAERQIRATAEQMAADDGASRVGVETLIAAWVRTTPESLRPDLPRQMDRFGLDSEEYGKLLQ